MSKGSRLIIPLITALALLLISGCAKQSVSTATIQFSLHKSDEDEKVLRALVQEQNTNADVIAVRNTELFQIRVTDMDPQKAADDANQIVDTLQSQIKTSYPSAKFVIWERAEAMVRN